MRRLFIFLLLLDPCLAAAQDVLKSSSPVALTTPLQLSPQAAYDEAVRPLDIVRRAAQNWSDMELAALDVAEGEAKVACRARTPEAFTGEDLLAYASLCAFAQLWQPVKRAATNYLIAYSAASPADKLIGFPNLSMAFDYVVQSSLHLNEPTNAFGTAQTMLRTVPYDDLASDAVNATVRYVQLIQTDQAISLLAQRQPLLLALLKGRVTPGAAAATAAPAPPGVRPPMPIHSLYADAIALPAMQQFANQPKAAADSLAELEATLPANLSPDDAILTAASRRQYLLLGSPLPTIPASAWLLDRSYVPPRDLNTKFGSASVFLLFPDWCAQCVGMKPQFLTAATRLNQSAVYFYVLLAQADPQPPAPKDPPKLAVKPSAAKSVKPVTTPGGKAETPHVEMQLSVKPVAAELLLGTPTLIVPPQTIDTFVATDFPLLIVTDHAGIVRYIQTAPDNALVQNGLIDQLAQRILEQWPVLAK